MKSLETIRGSIQEAGELLSLLVTCHHCGGVVLFPEQPTYCEGCSRDCVDHDEATCPTRSGLYDRIRAALIKAAISVSIVELEANPAPTGETGAPPSETREEVLQSAEKFMSEWITKHPNQILIRGLGQRQAIEQIVADFHLWQAARASAPTQPGATQSLLKKAVTADGSEDGKPVRINKPMSLGEYDRALENQAAPAPSPAEPPAGISLIAAERKRQVESEGWTPRHDDEHDGSELAWAAVCYAAPSPVLANVLRYRPCNCRSASCEHIGGMIQKARPCDPWPWDGEWDKRTKHTAIRKLQIAGALIAAEIDRLLRAAPPRRGDAAGQE